MKSARRIAGYSLIELMISLALGAVVTVGIIQLFEANSDTYTLLQGQSRMQESARFAFAFIGRDTREAGYVGCFSTATGMNSTIQPVSNIPYEFNLESAVQGYAATGTNTWSPAALPANGGDLPSTVGGTDTNVFTTTAGVGAGNGIDTSRLASGSDILTLRHMSLDAYRLTQDMTNSGVPIVIASPPGSLAFGVDDLVVIEDCEKASIFRVTAVTPDSPAAGQTTIGHDINDTDATRNTVVALATDTFESEAMVGTIETDTYYVAPGSGVNDSGNTPMSLWRKSGTDAPVELVEGIEDLHILYGFDSDSDGVPNQYIPANAVSDWSKVKTVRVGLVANSIDDVGGTSTPTLGCAVQGCITGKTYDGLIRREFTQTFDLRDRR